ncbi:MAG TPA: hypothetical protein ENI82_03615 [Bacteroidetes bacterium]|nr:hypothetical protein [Bacteroidota bacterium]
MSSLTYDEAKKGVFKGMWILAIVTLVEVFVSLLGKGHIGGIHPSGTIMLGTIGLILTGLSLYKAYYIIYYFMHMAHEVRGLRWTVLFPTILLLWAIIAFFQEGNSWGKRRALIQQKDKIEVKSSIKVIGADTKPIQD